MVYNFPVIINTNTGSLSKKIDNCEAICKANYADVACISERWLKEDIPNAGIKISGFIPGRNDCPGIKKEMVWSAMSRRLYNSINGIYYRMRRLSVSALQSDPGDCPMKSQILHLEFYITQSVPVIVQH